MANSCSGETEHGTGRKGGITAPLHCRRRKSHTCVFLPRLVSTPVRLVSCFLLEQVLSYRPARRDGTATPSVGSQQPVNTPQMFLSLSRLTYSRRGWLWPRNTGCLPVTGPGSEKIAIAHCNQVTRQHIRGLERGFEAC